MTLINLRALGVTLRNPLFSQLDLTIAKGDRIGLVAANGRGKSTLLRVMAGEVEATTGDITRARGAQVGLVTQEVPPALLDLTLRQAVTGDIAAEDSWRVDIVLDDFEVPEDLRDRVVSGLSGGWQRLMLLARVWVREPDVLLMDEPTNHLDLARIGWLERWLRGLPRDVVVMAASHDRAFLDAVTNRTLFLRQDRSPVFALPYSRARIALDDSDEAEERRFQNDLAKAGQLRKQAAKLKNIGINSGSDLLVVKTRQLTERADKIEARARPGYQEKSAGAIRLSNSGSHVKALITLEDAVVMAPDGRVLFKTGQLWISPGERIVVLGPNGAGKSRLLTMVRAAIDGKAVPQVKVAPSLRPGMSDQELSELARDRTPMEAVTRRFDVGDQRARALLAGAGMEIAAQDGKVSALSGGQRARLAMLILRLSQPNFYVLDEPTNHLDIEGQDALESELNEQGAACLIVSHDRSFVRGTGNRFWLIDRKRIVEVESPEGYFTAALGV